MNTKNTASQPKAASIADDAQFVQLLDEFWSRQFGTIAERAEDIFTHLDSKLSAPADQAASVAQEPVAEIMSDYMLVWAGQGPIAPLIERNSLKVGDKLYAKPVAAEGQVSAAAPADLSKLPRYSHIWTTGQMEKRENGSYFEVADVEALFRASEGQAQTSAGEVIAVSQDEATALNNILGAIQWNDTISAAGIREVYAADMKTSWEVADRALAAQSADKATGADHG
jgi:hypothetical protein